MLQSLQKECESLPVSQTVVRLGLRRMQWKEQSVCWTVKDCSKRIAVMVRSSSCRFQSYCDALVDEVWMVKEVRVTGSLRRMKDGDHGNKK